MNATEERTIAEKIQALCEAEQISVYQLAKQWKMPYNTLRDWASGDHEPRGLARDIVLQRLRRQCA